MIKEAIQYISNLKKDPLVITDGKVYNCKLDNTLIPIEEVNKKRLNIFDTIETQSLQSIIDFLVDNPEDIDENCYIHIVNEKIVILKSSRLGDYEENQIYIHAHYNEPVKKIGNFISYEELLIMLNSTFLITPDVNKIVSLLSNIKENDVKEHEDNGIIQTVKIKKGVDLASEEKIPRLLTLAPFRTFSEISQPESEFLFRARKGYESLEYAIFNADGGAWKLEAMQNIKSYLNDELIDRGIDMTILS